MLAPLLIALAVWVLICEKLRFIQKLKNSFKLMTDLFLGYCLGVFAMFVMYPVLKTEK
jgi:hypothetical protein